MSGSARRRAAVARTSRVALTIALLLACGARRAEAAGAADRRTRVAILPMVVHSLEEQNYLREGIADMLATRVGQSPSIAVVRVADAGRATTEPEAARAVAQEVGAAWVVFGAFTRFGDGASLDVQCARTDGSGEARAIFVQSGALGEIIPKVDELAERVVHHVTTGGQGGSDVPARSISPGPGPGGLGDALAEIDSLRERVERLEEQLHGSGTPAPAGGAPRAE
jgi:TolB-like protein